MNDAENLTKLLGHLPPETFHDFITDELGMILAPLDTKESKKKQRKAMEGGLTAIDVNQRQKIEEVAERIVLLTDGAGQDVIEGFRDDIFDESDREDFAALRNQYERALWLYVNEPNLFKEALDSRQADVYRQSVSCYSGFIAPMALSVITDTAIQGIFHQNIAQQLGCGVDAVAIQIFKRLRPDTQTGEDVDLYQISIHHNRPPEIMDCVQDSELISQEIIRAVSSHITYEPATGHLEVLSKDTSGREMLARIVADLLLQSPISGDKIPIKQYDYQSLAAPRNFELAGENISSVKVTELGYTVSNQTLLVKIWAKNPDDIYTAAKSLINPTFDFRQHHLTYVKLSICLKKIGKDRARTITIILRDDNKCNIKTKREKDRALCDRLLAKWNLVKEIGDAAKTPVDQVAA
jgi:hypothetical protein